MTLDLSALTEVSPTPEQAAVAAKANGEPLLIPLADIELDADQPRKKFDPVKMAELTATVRDVGVIQPVGVVAHPDKPGKWLLHHGERRYRASIDAGLETIPAFVRQRHDKYEQVIENLQREGLTAMELAMFIDLRLKAGDKKAAIAKALGVDAAVVTNHLALIDAPPSIDALYNSGRCTSARVIYDLRTLHKNYPAEVDAFCDASEDVTRAAVLALAAQLKSAAKAAQLPSEAGDASKPAAPDSLVRTKESEEGGANETSGDGAKPTSPSAPPAADDGQGDASGAGASDAPEGTTSWPRGKAVADPDLMKRPLLMVKIDGRSAAVLLNRRPTTVGLVHVCYENGEKAEVSATECVLDTLTDEEA